MSELALKHCATCLCVEQHPLHSVTLGKSHGLEMQNPRSTARLMRSAHFAVVRALVTGTLVRPTTCECCGHAAKRIGGAHFDYRMPMDVLWLCGRCHRLWDNAVPKWTTLPGEINDPIRVRNTEPVRAVA